MRPLHQIIVPLLVATTLAVGCVAIEKSSTSRDLDDRDFANTTDMQALRQAAVGGDPGAQWWLPFRYEIGTGVEQDYCQAARWFRKAAEQEYPAAQWSLGILYHNGQGVAQNYYEAARWCRRAAEHGVVDAQFNLANMYFHGQGMMRDYAEAMRWHHRAAEQGNMYAQYLLGIAFKIGEGVPQDLVFAHKWLNLAGRRPKKARRIKPDAESKMSQEQVTEAHRLAREWIQELMRDFEEPTEEV